MGMRTTGLLGLASFACIVVAALLAPLWEAPGTTASAREIASYVQSNREGGLWSLFVYSLGMGLFLCFAGGLWGSLRRTSPSSSALPAVFALAATALVTLILAAFAPAGIDAYRPQPPALAQMLWDLTFALLALSGIPTAIALGAYAAMVRATRLLPIWTAWLALVGVAGHVLIAASLLWRTGFFSLEGEVILLVPGTFFAWILATSVALLRAPDPPPIG
jgi:hypothetical protein